MRIFWISFWTLFAEMLVIRWLSSEIRIFSYVSNLALIASFLGIGLGCCTQERPNSPLLTLGGITALVALVTLFPLSHQTTMWLGWLPDSWVSVFRGNPSNTFQKLFSIGAGTFFSLGIFLILTACFVPLGQLLGQALQQHSEPLTAYTQNLLGSLAGILVFYLISAFRTPPAFWFLCLGLGLFCLFSRGNRPFRVMLLALVPCLILFPRTMDTQEIWSPYVKVTLSPMVAPDQKTFLGYRVRVNEAVSMQLINMSEEFVRGHPELFPPETVPLHAYNLPYEIAPQLDRVLILGAGGGNDAAGALRHGAKFVDAIEIDPVLAELGRTHHPEHPYINPRIHLYQTDARLFLERSRNLYDLITFSNLYAHTLSSSRQVLRLDDTVHTRQSVERMRRLLSEKGLLIIQTLEVRPWLVPRTQKTLQEVFGHPPLAFRPSPGRAVLVIGRNPEQTNPFVTRDPLLDRWISQNLIVSKRFPPITTDDWPYFYLEKPGIPSLHALMVLSLLVLFVIGARGADLRFSGTQGSFFFLGAGFLLLEIHNVSRLGLLHGVTWQTTAIALSWIFLLLFLANAWCYKHPSLSLRAAYGGLFLALGMNILIPERVWLALPVPAQIAVSGLWINLPILFSGVIFTTLWTRTAQRNAALGYNLLGSVVGGCLHILSFCFGIRGLLVIASGLYAGSFFFLDLYRPDKPGQGDAV